MMDTATQQSGRRNEVKVMIYAGSYDNSGRSIALSEAKRIVQAGDHEIYSKTYGGRVRVDTYTPYIRLKRRQWAKEGYAEKQIKEQFDKLKGALPAVTWSGLFTMARRADLITKHSGMIVADVDKMTAAEIQAHRGSLVNDPHVWLLFTSPSETGLKIVFPLRGLEDQWPVRQDMSQPEYSTIANQFQYAAYFVLRNYMRERHGLQIDSSCKDSSRLCYLPHDPNAHFNGQAEPLMVPWSKDIEQQILEERAREREEAARKRDQGKGKADAARPSSKSRPAQGAASTGKPGGSQANGKAEDNGPFHQLSDQGQEQLVDACLDALHPDSVPAGFGASDDPGDRHRWDTSIGMAVHSWDAGDRGLQKYLAWGGRSAHKSENERAGYWPSFSSNGQTTVGTLLKFGREAGATMPWASRSRNRAGQGNSNNGQAGSIDESGVVVLPSGDVTISQCAADVFKRIAPTHTMFYRGGSGGGVVVELSHDRDGNANLEPLKGKAFRTRVERFCRLMAWRVGKGEGLVLKPSKMAVDDAESILLSLEARELLPPVSSVLRCAVLTENADGQLLVLNKGYHPELGGLLITQAEGVPDVPLEEAVRVLLKLGSNFEFQTDGDKSRNLAARITPALRMGGFLKRSIPLDVMEADQSQAGKGYSHCITTAIYNEAPYLVTQRKGGVGSMDETFATALVSGRPFISLDNIRDKLDSPYFESFLTCPGMFPARIPGGLTIMIDPRRSILQLTSNGMESTRDLANRASICRINKRSNFQHEDLPSRIREDQAFTLGCVFSVIREWHRQGKPRTKEMRHDFHEWCQTLDWIVQNVLDCAPLMEGHQEAQKRVSNPVLSWLRNVALELERQNRLGELITASTLVNICLVAGIDVPCRSKVDERTARQVVGGLMHREFRTADRLVLEGFCIEKDRTEYRKPSGDLDMANAYRFIRTNNGATK